MIKYVQGDIMKKLIIFFSALLLSLGSLSAITPLASIPATKPDFESLSRRDLFSQMREIYQAGLIFTAQLETLGETPLTRLASFPSDRMLESISKKDIVVIAEDNYVIAKKLKLQLDSLPPLNIRISEMKEKMKTLEKKLIDKDYEVFDAVNSCVKEKMALSVDLNKHCERYLDEMFEQYNQNYKNSVSILSFSPVGNWYIFDNPQITSDISMGARLDFNAYPILRFNKNIEIWGEYTAPRISTISHWEFVSENGDIIDEGNITEKWAMDLYSLGISYAVRHAFSIAEDTDVGFRFGLGYIWGEGKIYNSDLPRTTWESTVVRIEANVVKYRWFYPIELFAAYNWYTNTDDLVLRTNLQNITHNSSWLNTVQLGLRMSFWWQPNVQEPQTKATQSNEK